MEKDDERVFTDSDLYNAEGCLQSAAEDDDEDLRREELSLAMKETKST
jgi:hypothetical protein